jgi:hypothetical protein
MAWVPVPFVVGVYVTEQVDGPVPLPVSVQVALVVIVPVPLLLKLTVPAGAVLVPVSVSLTVAVQTVEEPIVTVPGAQLTAVEVARPTTTVKLPLLPLWVPSPP